MIDKFEIKGLWFLPQNKNDKVTGILSFDPINGSYLELIGSLDENEMFHTSQEKCFIILGTSVDSEAITLYNCYFSSRQRRTLRNEETGPISERYYVNFILKGYHFENEESIKFNTISSSLQNFDEWVNISGFQNDSEINIENSYCINYVRPKDIEFDLHTDHRGKFTFLVSRPNVYSQKNEYIIQETWLELNSKNEKSLKEIRELLTRFQNFLILGIYKSVFPNKVILYNDSIQNDFGRAGKYRKPIEFYQATRKRRNEKEKQSFEMLFNYTQIKADFPKIIKNWFEKYNKLSPAFNLLFDQFYNGAIFNENTFLNLAQSAETLHSRLYNHTKMPKNDYKKMKQHILEVLPIEYHNWMKEQLNFGNHLDLSQRLTELTEKYSNEVINKAIPDKSEFVQQVKNLRNYYTHYSESLEKKIIPEKDLLFLSERLKMLLVSGFLFEIGMSKEMSNKLFKNANQNLFRHLTP
ncbi:hypothetical protein ASF10_14140 [Flavobacterium sp. Leaf82]|uniref:ApeA N-terminal domain 1-containing protein n=1 Tax=Flavobacterium sp. Leaf82 TaxID=1736238 RepID=UPI0006F9E4D9|nr:HEPN domain-containing protein [Flavobacterium sp. Leaf82]KQO21255.1 hypothetical protein ASF10_14140 [Flavobacterium sp. Leaf82]